ncbi:MAG TPA: sulfatase-like hydrolase/transferase [Bacteroidales bacterium]|nr:sulfatase-like hydrolase/transferase [Bacteroidales bacterium]
MKISKNQVIRGLLLPGMVAAGFLPSCQVNKGREVKIKNVVILIGDDHSSEVLGCYGNDIVRTPNLDRLASQSTIFTDAYSNAPVCSASRQSLLTGRYPHATGVTLLTTPFQDEGNLTLAEILKRRGFVTGVIGKTHFNNYGDKNPSHHGFDVMVDEKERREWLKQNPPPPIPDSIKTLGPWRPFKDPARIWLNADYLPTAEWAEDGSAAWDARKAIDFLRENKDTSFLMWVGFHEPHSPFNFPVEYRNKYNPGDMPVPEGSPEDDRFIPAIFRNLTKKDKQGIIASYYTSVEYLDENVGKIINEIDKLGLDDNTLVIYLGDQGYLLGDHKRFEKHTMWDPAVKAPLIFYTGGLYGKGQTNDALVEFIDVVPTVLDFLNIPVPAEVQGKSMKPIITGSKNEINHYVFAEFLVDNKAMVTDGKWKYIFTTGAKDLGQGYATGFGPTGILHKLYNLDADPGETTNLAGKPENRDRVEKMQEKMIHIFENTYPGADSLPSGLSNVEKLEWFCRPPDKNANINAK